MEDIIEVKTDNEKSYAECVWQVNPIDYTTMYIDLDKFKRIVLRTEYDEIEFEPYEIIYLLVTLKDIMSHGTGILELLDRKQEIFNHLEGRRANLL